MFRYLHECIFLLTCMPFSELSVNNGGNGGNNICQQILKCITDGKDTEKQISSFLRIYLNSTPNYLLVERIAVSTSIHVK